MSSLTPRRTTVHLLKAGDKLEGLMDLWPGDKVYLQDGRTGDVTHIADVNDAGKAVPIGHG